jgi:hypothetical protein
MGSEWLTRATQTGAENDDEPDDTREVPREPGVGVSEGSYRSAFPDGLDENEDTADISDLVERTTGTPR